MTTPPGCFLSSGPSKHYGQALRQVLNVELPRLLTDCYTAGLNDAINILLVKIGLVRLSSQCIGLHVLRPDICYSPALTILSWLTYSVMNRSAWKLNKLRCKRLNKPTILNLFDHLSVLCAVKKKQAGFLWLPFLYFTITRWQHIRNRRSCCLLRCFMWSVSLIYDLPHRCLHVEPMQEQDLAL